MNCKIFFCALLLMSLLGCKSKSAFNFSEDIVKKERALIPEIELTEEKVEKFANAEQFDSIAIASEKMEGLIEKTIDEIKLMKVPDAKEVDNFKQAMLEYFAYIKSMYTGYKDLGNAKTIEEREEVVKMLKKIVSGKNSAISKMQTAQRKYANANGFKLESE